MSLDRALQGMLGDRAAEQTVREVLGVLTRHRTEWMEPREIARVVERPESVVSSILSKLSVAFVVRTESGRFRLDPDPVVELDIKRFLHRSDAHSQLAQNNLARFRDRYGHH
jgi:DNA-binding IclR family transcriptional regulator